MKKSERFKARKEAKAAARHALGKRLVVSLVNIARVSDGPRVKDRLGVYVSPDDALAIMASILIRNRRSAQRQA